MKNVDGLSGNSCVRHWPAGSLHQIAPCSVCRADASPTRVRCSVGRWTSGGYPRAARFGLQIVPTGVSIFGQFVSVLAIIAAQAFLIAALLFERRSRRRTASRAGAKPEADEPGGARGEAFHVDLGRGPRQDLGDHAIAPRRRIARGAADRLRRCAQRGASGGSRGTRSSRATRRWRPAKSSTSSTAWQDPMATCAGSRRADGRRRATASDCSASPSTSRSANLPSYRPTQDRAALRHMTRVSMLGQLSASIAHQLNQPLAAILGNAEAAQKMLGREPRRSRRSCGRSATTS